MDDVYMRQDGINDKVPNVVCVVGCGGVGAWGAIFSAMSGVEKLLLFDDDFVEIHNLNRLPFTKDDVGKKKTTVLKKLIKSLRKDAVVFENGEISPTNIHLLEGCVLDCVDVLRVQRMISRYCKLNNIFYVRCGADINHITVSDGEAVWGEGDGGYIVVPSWVVPSALSAAYGVASLFKGQIVSKSEEVI